MPAVSTQAPVVEAFVSFQGEGPQVGEPTLFVRTALCPLRCAYCDTTESFHESTDFSVRDLDGRVVAKLPNPVGAGTLLDAIPYAALRGVSWLAWTGGEPLVHAGFGHELLAAARQRGMRTHLETAGLDAAALARVLPLVDHLSLDWKLPSTLLRPYDAQPGHEACLDLAVAAGIDTAVKIVLVPGIPAAEWRRALRRLVRFAPAVLVVLQPVTPCLEVSEPLSRHDLLRCAREALDAGMRVRVLPQVHKILGLD